MTADSVVELRNALLDQAFPAPTVAAVELTVALEAPHSHARHLTLVLEYKPTTLCVESQSLKRYLKAAVETAEAVDRALAGRIAEDLWILFEPESLTAKLSWITRSSERQEVLVSRGEAETD